MLDRLSGALKKATDKIANAIFLDKKVVDAVVKELQRALIEADVNIQLVLQLSQKIKKAALDENIKGIEKKEHIIKLLHDELIAILGDKREVVLDKKRNVLMMLGLYGAGKTTTIGKLALYYAKRGNKVCAIGLDVHRPAAGLQLKQVMDKLELPAFIEPEEKDPLKIWKKYEKDMSKYNVILLDTAGRDALDEELVQEIEEIANVAKPTETFLVLPADIGQTAKKQAETYKEAVDITGVIITRMDSTAKAGGALTACHEAQVPVVFIGTGEKAHDLEHFNPERFLSRMLGMGDLESLMEKIQSATDEKALKKSQQNFAEGKLTLKDVQQQLEAMESMGSMDKIMSMIPGMGKAKVPDSALVEQQEKMKRYKNAISSMTQEEIEHPEVLEKQTSRLKRIAQGSGTSTTDIRNLLKQYKMLKELAKSQSAMADGNLDQKTLMKLARKMGKKGLKGLKM